MPPFPEMPNSSPHRSSSRHKGEHMPIAVLQGLIVENPTNGITDRSTLYSFHFPGFSSGQIPACVVPVASKEILSASLNPLPPSTLVHLAT